MSYTWTNGETITAEKLNNTGGGGGGSGVFVIPATLDEETATTTLGKTWNEINTAMGQGKLCVVAFSNESGSSTSIAYGTYYEEGLNPEVWLYDFENVFIYNADSVDDYPSYTDN